MGKRQLALQMGENGNRSLCLDEQAHSEPGKGPGIEGAPNTPEAWLGLNTGGLMESLRKT